MSTQKNRINTIIAIVNSSPVSNRNVINKIKAEFRQVTDVDNITPARRKNILKILHSTRALDTSLGSFLDHYGIKNNSHSIGQYLGTLTDHNHHAIGNLTSAERTRYQREIVKIRNMHLHQADSYPQNDSEVYTVIAEMQSLMTRVMSL